MFLSAEELSLAYGVDPVVARSYVDRRVPSGNAYWKGRLLYMPPVPGFLFMPIFSDLCVRCGIPREALLSDRCLSLAEAILDSAARQEDGSIDAAAHVHECLSLALPHTASPGPFDDLRMHLESTGTASPSPLHTPFPSLRRADTYLLSVCAAEPDQEAFLKAADAWRSFMTFLLVQDDLADIREDLERGQENSFVDAGLSREGADRVMSMVDEGLGRISGLNPVLAERLSNRRRVVDLESLLGPYFR